MKNLEILAYQNGIAGLPCPCDPYAEPEWQCREPCSVIQVPELPSGAKIVIDGRTKNVRVTFAGGYERNGLRFLSSADGQPFSFLEVSACAELCVIIKADCENVAPDATVSVGLIGRHLASGGF